VELCRCSPRPPHDVWCLMKHRDDVAPLASIEYDFVTVTQRVLVTSPLMGSPTRRLHFELARTRCGMSQPLQAGVAKSSRE
jgi:hypothetical protein